MDDFKLWMISLCGATAITSLFRILLSGSSLNKVLNIFFSIFILFYTVMPLQSFLNNKSYEVPAETDETEYNELYRNGYEQIIEMSVEKECENLSVEVLSFEINSYIDNDGYLCVNKLEISIDNKEKISQVESELRTKLGFEVSVK